jgi:hypothetical protein
MRCFSFLERKCSAVCWLLSSCAAFLVLLYLKSHHILNIHTYTNHILSREDLVSKFQTDIPTLSPTDLQTEVDKFLMDGEMLDIFIKYNQRKAEDPDWEPLYAPENNSPFRKAVDFVSQYGFYVVLGVLAKDIVDGYIQKGGDGGAAGAGGEVVDTLVSQVHQITTTLSA